MTVKHGGAWPTMVTPYGVGNQVDMGAYRSLVDWYIVHGVGGLYANCLSSEMYHLSGPERVALVREAVRASDGRVPVAATGNLGQSFGEHVEHSREIAAAGADVVMLLVPPHLDSDDGLRDYYARMADSVDALLGLYECPVPRPYNLSVRLIGELADSGRFVAFKETSCDLPKIKRIAERTSDTPLALLQANTPYLLESVRAGAPGTMSIAACWVPDLVSRVIELARENASQAQALQSQLTVMDLATRHAHPLSKLWLLKLRGLDLSPRSRVGGASLSGALAFGLETAAREWFHSDGSLIVR